MKRAYLIIGEGGTGKSTSIRCLTGIRQQNRIWVALINGQRIHLWAWMRAAQEAWMLPQDVVDEIMLSSEANFHDYLLPLRVNPVNNCPGYTDYITALQQNGITIMNVAVLTRGNTNPNLILPVNPTIIPVSNLNPPNMNANIIRNNWGWL